MSIYDLLYNYICFFYPDKAQSLTKEDKKDILNQIASLLRNGWTSEEIQRHIVSFSNKNKGRVLNLGDYFDSMEPSRVNKIVPFKFYYHNQLRVLPPPPVIDFDYDTGEIKRQVHEYFLEMKASYTVEDLYEYFINKTGLHDKRTLNPNRIIGSLNWLLGKFDLDLILFMMDAAADDITSNDKVPLSTPMEVQEYIRRATTALDQKVTESKLSGDDKVVPRKRVLPS